MSTRDMKKDLPKWVFPTLQGIVFWLGYKKQYYSGYHLTEGAIIGEITQLIASNLDKSEKLKCEVLYNEIIEELSDSIRIDLSIYDRVEGKCLYALEIKRYEAGINLIEKDLQRLYELKNHNDDIRCFLIVVSQNDYPEIFVTEEGNSKKYNIAGEYGFDAYIRRTCKASSSFKVKDSANFASIIEVL